MRSSRRATTCVRPASDEPDAKAAASVPPVVNMAAHLTQLEVSMLRSPLAAVVLATAFVTLQAAQSAPPFPAPPAGSSAGPLAYSCGVPPNPAPAGRGAPPVFPAGQFPVQLPAVSMLGAHNDLPNPYRDGVDWGQLPGGRKWGSTASVSTAPD